ncbi:MAG: hypothetical protein R2823_04305 [Acidimicrobiia bacterium]
MSRSHQHDRPATVYIGAGSNALDASLGEEKRMHKRFVMLVVLVATMVASVGGASAQSKEPSELAKLIRAFRDAQVTGPNVEVTDPDDVDVLSPFGGPSQLPMDMQDQVRIASTIEFQVFPGQRYTHFAPMGTEILISNADNGAVTTELVDLPLQQGWIPPLDQGAPFTVDSFFDVFFDIDLPPDFGPMFGQGEPFEVDGAILVPPAGGVPTPMDQPLTIRGAVFGEPLPNGYCNGTIVEFFSGDAIMGQQGWTPADFAPNDVFTDLRQAHVSRCVDGVIQPTQWLRSNGSSFQPEGSRASSVWFPGGFMQIIPNDEIIDSTGSRIGGFITPSDNPFQPDTTGFSTFPNFPSLHSHEMPTTFINHPWPGAALHPVAYEFGESDTGSAGFQDNYGLLLDTEDEVGEPNEFSAMAIQLGTYQLKFGILTYDADADSYSGTLEGSGEGYSEQWDVTAGDIEYTYTNDEGTQVYPGMVLDGTDASLLEEMATVTAERVAAATTTTTTAATTTTAEDTATGGVTTTVATSTPADGGGGFFIWLLLALVILAIVGGLWWFLFRAKKDPCKELYEAWQVAKAACDKATKDAADKRQKADDATKAREKAEKDREDHCKQYPPACGPPASASSGGRTVTRDDLHVVRAWNAAAWAGYKNKTKSAQDVQDDWNNGPTDEFRTQTLKDLEAAKAKTPKLDQAIKDAKQAEQDADAAADKAEAAAKKACDEAAAAKKAYDACIGKAAAAGDTAAVATAGAAVGGMAGAAAGAAVAGAEQAGGKNCEPQQKAYDAAKKACDEATDASQKAEQAARDAQKALEEATKALKDLCEEYPPLCGEEAWIQEAGKPETRITRSDLYVRNMWAEQVWVDYQTEQISAQEASDRWGQDPPADFAADELQKVEDARPLKAAREKAIKDAEAKVADANKAAADARQKATDACAKADAAKRALDACLGSA